MSHGPTLTAVILAGGAGSRMGFPKSQLVLHGQPVLNLLVASMAAVASTIIVVGDVDQHDVGAAPVPVKIIPDRTPLGGPLQAIATAIEYCEPGLLMAIGCDMPFVSADLLAHATKTADDFEAVVPVAEGRFQPLHAVYRTSIAPVVERLSAQGTPSLRSLLEQLRLRTIERPEWSRFSPDGRCFLNINRPEDLRLAESLLR